MPEEIIPAPAIVDVGRPKKITCEFCECELGRSGEYVELSAKAKMLRKLKDENEKLEGTLATVRTQVEDLKREIEQLRPKERKGSFSF
jgi:predicted RNase H-like nuclease (RuvC/YqgF family)